MTLQELNSTDTANATTAFTKCCGSSAWANKMATSRPYNDAGSLYETASTVWAECSEKDWLEAFTHHPKIGDIESLSKKYAHTKEWAGNEQKGMDDASFQLIERLAAGNKEYEDKFGFIFIVCATGKSAEQMFGLLEERLPNDRETELKIAAGEQEKITRIRLEKLLS